MTVKIDTNWEELGKIIFLMSENDDKINGED